MMREEWEPASVQYDDYRGTAAMDDPHDGSPVLAEYARIDQSRWLVFGIELFGGGAGEADNWAWIVAVDRDRIRTAGSLAELIEENGGRIPATRLPFRESDAFGVLRAMKQWAIRVRVASIEDDVPIEIEGDAPESGR